MEESDKTKKFVEIFHLVTREIEKTFDVTGRSDRYIETIMNGISRNLGDSYDVREVSR